MKTSDESNWAVFLVSPLLLLVLAVPLLGALQFAAQRVQDAAPRPAWSDAIEQVNRAIARNDAGGALRAWYDAYNMARGTRAWRPLVEVGDAALKIGHFTGSPRDAAGRARDAYLIALFRARRDRDIDGLLRVAESFAKLGDHEVTLQCLAIADRVVMRSGDDAARERLRDVTERLSRPVVTGAR
ncbi:MAG: hypothetical protein DMD91_10285 [Candidatus Rokuibacteriota bacterium]|nr:MAG: hypothetical protein DMD91_10285 [Candidatus Rokubacteria bacterium]